MGVRSKSRRNKQIKRNIIRNKTPEASEEASIGTQDRISQLPDHILQNIIFHLQRIELEGYSWYRNSAINFVVSSKACHQAWLFRTHHSFFGVQYHDHKYEKEESFKDFMDQYISRLMSYGRTITSFSLNSKLSKPSHLIAWFKGLDVLKVKTIHLDFLDREFKMPMSLFSYISTLEEISLHNCTIESSDEEIIRLPSVLTLRMKDVNADSSTVEKIIRGCPSLNHLEILFIHSILATKDNVYTLEIDAPCLTKFSFNWKTTVVPCFGVDSCCSHLRELSLRGTYVVNEKTLDQLLTRLTNLDRLSITDCNVIRDPCISSLSVTELQIDDCYIEGVMRIDCPNLHRFYYRTYRVPHLHHQSTWDWKLDLHLDGLSYGGGNTDRFFKNLRSFLSDTKINVTCLRLDVREMDFFNERHELNMKVIDGVFVPWPQLTNLKHLKLGMWTCLYFPWEILHGLLWICRPDFLTCTFYSCSSGELKRLLPSIKKVVQNNGVRWFVCACLDGSVSNECWHHSLSDVKMEWCGITEYWHWGVDYKSLGLDGLSELAMSDFDFLNVRVTFKLVWQ